MLSSRVAEPQESIVAGEAVHWTLANDGDVAWPSGTTLRLVGGPVVLCPMLEVPVVQPGQTVTIDLESKVVDETVEIFYSLVTPDCQPFGEIVRASVVPKIQHKVEPAVAVLAAPNDEAEAGVEALQGELLNPEWVLANVGQVPWPEDVKASLIYNTPGFANLPGGFDIPSIQPGQTVHAGVQVIMPEQEGQWKAIWAVTSASHPAFAEVLVAEFKVDAFPFMEWMLAEEAEAGSVSEASTLEPEKEIEPGEVVSAAVIFQQHIFAGPGEADYPDVEGSKAGVTDLGIVSGVPAGQTWRLEMAVANDGREAWPEDTELACCFGTGFGCGLVGIGAVQPGETVMINMDLTSPELPTQSAWVFKTGPACFGAPLLLDVQ